MKQIRAVRFLLFGPIIVSLSFIGFVFWDLAQPATLTVRVLDIGQGDSILIQTAGRRTILVDGGPDNTVIHKLGEYLPFYQRTIDLVVLTHPDADHLMGLNEVLERYQVGAVLLTGVSNDSGAYQSFLELIASRGVQTFFAGAIHEITIDNQTTLVVLHPSQPLIGQTVEESNDASIVSQLRAGDFTVLLTGDAPQNIETALLEGGVDVRSTVLKISHHGSRTASGEAFLRAVAPQLALISSGRDNRFGHPHLSVLERLTGLGIPVFNTQQAGDITVKFGTGGISVSENGIEGLEK